MNQRGPPVSTSNPSDLAVSANPAILATGAAVSILRQKVASLVPPKLPAHVHYHEFLKAAWSHLPNPIIAASHVVDAADVLAMPQDQ